MTESRENEVPSGRDEPSDERHEATVRELNEAILELQRDLCRYAGMPMPSEREAFAKARNDALEEAAKVADRFAAMARKDGISEFDVAARGIASSIRALKAEGTAAKDSGPSTERPEGTPPLTPERGNG